ncbi:hypothetical protein SPI_08651 [Niveomyces insectorum RCEF 264]|uniref:Metalloprotease m41 n=1 Tax=Niveomyces insectorum RCEF 264 TaxID=1081102 RepID=A0A162MDW4_9HYPO|nr:hypothetical protein SPI_08651 [Niveomyces insectorum RCEF 264]
MADTPDYQALYEEAERLRQEERRLRQQAELREQAEQRLRKQAEIEAERARQTIRETSTFNSLLQDELAKVQAFQALQSLQAYLAQVSRLHVHLARLMPTPQQPPLRTNSSNQTTSGRTNIAHKYYPLRLRPWEDFLTAQKRTFSSVYSTLKDRQALPSRQSVQQDEVSLLEQLPLSALRLPGSMSAARTNQVINASLLIPASRVINEYLAITGTGTDTKQKVFFDTTTYGVMPETGSGSSVDIDTEDSTRRSSGSPTERRRKVMPDCLVLTMQMGIPGQVAEETAARRAAIGEHKPAHAVRSTSVMEIVGSLPENYMLRLAREALARRRKTAARTGNELAHGQAGDDNRATRPIEGSSPSTRRVDKQTYFAYALTQAYHYMIISGVEFGYVCTGETITFLCVREDDPGTLLYHTLFFPLAPLEDARSPPGPVTTTTDTAVLDEDTLSKMAIAELCSFCLLALESEVRPAEWTTNALFHLAEFPELPTSLATERAPSPSSSGARRRDSDDDGDNTRSRLLQPFSDGSTPGRGPSPLRQEVSAGQDVLWRSSEGHQRPSSSRVVKPTLPYCTQACLLGLVQEGKLDARCPNYQLHRQRADQPGHRHPIRQADLTRLVRGQLFYAPEVNCKCYVGHRGSIGYSFKISLTGFGYTFVGKAVEKKNRRRLVHETEIYGHLLPLQGIAVPVHLGLVDLIAPYPERATFALLESMMLLSYAGNRIPSVNRDGELANDVDGAQMPVDLGHETHRTLQELRELGLWDVDDNPDNILWCDDVQRVMRIDFDRAVLVSSRGSSQISDAPSTPGTGDTSVAVDTVHRDGEDGVDFVLSAGAPKRPMHEAHLASSHAQ